MFGEKVPARVPRKAMTPPAIVTVLTEYFAMKKLTTGPTNHTI